MKTKIVTASEIGKTAYCPHAHYLSTIHAADRATRKKLAHGNKMHNAIGDSSELIDKGSKLTTASNIVLIIIVVGLVISIFDVFN